MEKSIDFKRTWWGNFFADKEIVIIMIIVVDTQILVVAHQTTH